MEKAFGLKEWQATLASSVLMFGAGIATEYAVGSRPDAADLQANTAGILAGAGLKFLLHF